MWRLSHGFYRARLLQGYFSQVTVAPHLVEYLFVSVDYKHMESKAVDEYTCSGSHHFSRFL